MKPDPTQSAGEPPTDARNASDGQLTENLRKQADVLNYLHESVIVMDPAGFVTHWNKGAERMFGYASAEAIGHHILFLYADEDAATDDSLDRAFLQDGSREMEVRRRRKSGEVFWASLRLSVMRNDYGQPVALIGYLSDITERIKAREMLELHARIFNDSEEGILITDANLAIVSVNAACCRITGYAAEEMIGQSPRLLQSGRHDKGFYEEMWRAIDSRGNWRGELWDKRKNGEAFPIWISISVVRNAQGRITHYFAIMSDVSERKRSEEQIHYLAYFDVLTGLPNRSLFFRLTDQALLEAKRDQAHAALLFVDLDRFKPINDSLGHEVGNQLLRQVATRLREALRAEDVVARLGGDEFAVALFDIAQRDHAANVARKLLDVLKEPFRIHNHELKLGASIGIAIYPEDSPDTETLLRLADLAMYRAKQSGEGYAFFSEELNRRALQRLRVEAGLRRALAQDELLLHYQPKVDIATGRVVGAEALVRWRHPETGMVPPGEFIPVAEESGLVVDIGNWVLNAACAQASAWRQAGLPPVKIAVNLSAREFAPDLSERVKEVLDRHGLPPSFLELEITEGVLAKSTEGVIRMMGELMSLGIGLSLDDFGTGFSSLSYLKRFPVDTLKIDRSFVTGIPGDANDCAIAGAIVSMAKQLRHTVIAEGVETQDQLAFLRQIGCDAIQGFLFSRPLDAASFEALLREGRRF